MKLAGQLAFAYGAISLSLCACVLVWCVVDHLLELIGFRLHAPADVTDELYSSVVDERWLREERHKFLLIVGGRSERVH